MSAPIALETSPLLSSAAVSSTTNSQDALSSDQMRAIHSRLAELRAISDSRRTGVKFAAFLCLPLSIPCACLFGCCDLTNIKGGGVCINFERQDVRGIPYCTHTTCESDCDKPCWRAALPPMNYEDKSYLCDLVCDPCVCCFCCDKATPEVYLTLSEREEMSRLTEQSRTTISLPGAPLTQIMEIAKSQNPDLSAVDAMLSRYINIPDLRHIVHAYCRAPPSSDTRFAESRLIPRPASRPDSDRDMGGRGGFA